MSAPLRLSGQGSFFHVGWENVETMDRDIQGYKPDRQVERDVAMRTRLINAGV